MVLSQDGIFSRAEKATDKYGQAKARETLELALGEAQMQKYEEGLTDEQLDEQIKKVGSLIPKEDPNSNNQLVIVDGHIFEIDRSVPKIIDYKGPADGIIITASITQNGNWQNPVATVTGTITKYGGGTVVSSTAIATNGITISGFPTTGGSYTIQNITEDTDITITAQDSEGHDPVTEIIKVRLVRDTTPPIISNVNAIADGMKIRITAKAIDNESGVSKINYSITPTTVDSTTPAIGNLESGEEIEIVTTAEEEYTVTFKAMDNNGNMSEPKTVTPVITEKIIYKYIKIKDEGLRKVNTKHIYGSDVLGYSCTRTGVNWQLFYIDEEDDHRVYLISKDYMAPPTIDTEMIPSPSKNYPKAYYWNDTILDKYKTKIPNNIFTQKFLKEYSGIDATMQRSYQAVNYMLDQSIWKEYKGTNADYAFGGSTLSLLQASYNDICKIVDELEIQNSETGYEIKRKKSNSWDNNISGLGSTNTQKGLYFCGNDSKSAAAAAYLASPAGSRRFMECLV